MRKLTKKQLELTAEMLKIRHEEREKAIRARLESIARGNTFWEKIKLVFKI